MWQTPSKKSRHPGRTSIRGRGTRSQSRVRLRRTHAQIKILAFPSANAVIADARLLLNDISPNGLSLFCATSLLVGQEVAITMEDPTRVYVRGRIVSCLEYESSQHVLSPQTFHFRVGVQFLFTSPAERAEFKKYCDTLELDYLSAPKAIA